MRQSIKQVSKLSDETDADDGLSGETSGGVSQSDVGRLGGEARSNASHDATDEDGPMSLVDYLWRHRERM